MQRDHRSNVFPYGISEIREERRRIHERGTLRWTCNRCRTDKIVVKEIPIPTEKAMLVKVLMSMGERYELAGTTISVGPREVKAVFRNLAVESPNCPERALSRAYYC